MESTDVILEAQDLVKYFPIYGGLLSREIARVHALDGVSLRVRRGRTIGLVGESGCGKSTFGRTLLKLIEPTRGKIIYEGQDITRYTPSQMKAVRRDLQIVFQDPFSSLNPRWSVKQIVEEPYDIHRMYLDPAEREGVLAQLVSEVGLHPDSLNRYPHEFSGGQRQRIGIARALALKPKIIVADEPVSALDVSIQSQVLNLLMDLRDKYGLAYIFVAHDLAVIEHISDEVCVMYLGAVVEHTSSDALYEAPLHPYTRALIASIPKARAQKEKRLQPTLHGDVPSPIQPPAGCRFHTRCPHVQDVCKRDRPELRNFGTESEPHWVACHFVEKLR